MIANFPGYVFGRAFWWLLAALAVGVLIGWFLNGWRKKTWVDESSTVTSTSAGDPVTEERDRLRTLVDQHQSHLVDRDNEIAAVRSTMDDAVGRADQATAQLDAVTAERNQLQSLLERVEDARQAIIAERDQLREVITQQRSTVDHQAARLADCEATVARLRGDDGGAVVRSLVAVPTPTEESDEAPTDEAPTDEAFSDESASDGEAIEESPSGVTASVGREVSAIAEAAGDAVSAADELDLDEARRVLGVKVRVDDLKVVEGIGPKIDELLQAAGITTWAALSGTATEHLRQILDGGGERFRVHDPSSWPEQAALLAGGQWTAFKELTDRLNAGRD